MHLPTQHLTYCLNVHPGESWADNLLAIQTHALAIRDRVAPGKPFGLGMRLSHQAATTLIQPVIRANFNQFLTDQGLYAFTINGFPYGSFHTKPVKTAVYQPDWSTRQRLDYTTTLAHILADLLPEGLDGSISTVPLGYKFSPGSNTADSPSAAMATHLGECALSLHEILMKSGKEIHIGLEPEPDCLLETTTEVIQYFEKQLIPQAVPYLVSRLSCDRAEAEAIVRRHIGVCFDTCHLALQFENLSESLTRLVRHGIRISKVQLSSALEVVPTVPARTRLNGFVDPVYLHQVKALSLPSRQLNHEQPPEDGSAGTPRPTQIQSPIGLIRYADLDEALASPVTPDHSDSLWRIHFHVPLYFEGNAPLHSTSNCMDARFWNQLMGLPIHHLEIETYTFHVLPPALQADGVVASTVREYEWVTRRLPVSSSGE